MKLDKTVTLKNELVLKSSHYGDIAYDKNEVLFFEKGMLGFENLNGFILRTIEENKDFRILHSLDDGDIAFVVLNPFDFVSDYEIDLDEEVILKLEIEKENDVMILNTVTLSNEISKITTNLRAPIIINVKNNKAEQFILKTEKYKIKHGLVEEK
ncbi:flagellar assembly protein FliW [uncultured Clostridium sp.]|uniref:flagellar assembly protein FliW n=1 Tax=uncultured Clostridium sp. TaxID=59620 RepID=UPI00262A3419|nr:flagellar assembly protein FliW [uncultured Clostridium sp.]